MDCNGRSFLAITLRCLTIVAIQRNVGVCFGFDQGFTLSGIELRRYVTLRPELREISSEINKNGLGYLLDSPNITVFLPDNEAMARFSEIRLGNQANYSETLRSLILYHSVDRRLSITDIYDNLRLRSRTASPTMLYFNTFVDFDGKAIHTINGASMTMCALQPVNGAIFIIDRILAPFGSTKTITEYDNTPDLPDLSFTSVTALVDVNRPLFERANSDQYFFTVFSPNDSYTYSIPAAAQERFYTEWDLINDTIKAHIIQDQILCLPSEGVIPEMTTLNGQMKFVRREGKVYVENNRVQAEVIVPNIPLRNGVLHVIDSLLYFIYDNVYDKLQHLKEAETFTTVVDSIGPFTNLLRTDAKLTLFVPVTSAFAKLPSRTQAKIQSNVTLLAQLLNAHTIVGQDLAIEDLLQMGTITTLGNRTISVISFHNDIYIEHNGMRSKVIQTDIGCTNGVIHLINDVMIDSRLTVWENIESQSQLNVVHEYMRNHVDIRRALSTSDGSHVTAFLPGSLALQSLPEYAQRMLMAGGSGVHQALNGHIIEDTRLGSAEFKHGVPKKLISKNGDVLYVTKRGREIHVNGSHVTGTVQVSDIWCSNGVIHIIDRMLHIPTRHALDEMKDMFDTKSAATIFSASAEIRHLLSDNSSRVSVFVPTDKGLSKIPTLRINLLRQNQSLLNQFIKSHVISGKVIYTSEVPAVGEVFSAEEGKLRILKRNNKLYVKNGGVGAWFTMTDIPVTNGVIHVIDGPVWFAYNTVEEELVTNPDLIPFYGLTSGLPDSVVAIQPQLPVTVFVPSAGYFNSLETMMSFLKANKEFQEKIFSGHVLPNLIIDRDYISSQQSQWRLTNNKNVTFRFKKETKDSFSVGVYSDVSVSIPTMAIRCINGIIYLIDDLLNFSPYTVEETTERETSLMDVFGDLVRLSWNESLSNTRLPHTILAPDNSVSRKQGNALAAMLNNSQFLEEVKWRHISLGQILRLEDLLEGRISNNFTNNNVFFTREGSDVFVTWGRVKGRILRSNILTSNGIIHIVDKILFQINSPTTASLMPSSHSASSTQNQKTSQPTKQSTQQAKQTTTVPQKARTGKSINPINGAADLPMVTTILALSQFFLFSILTFC